jgi:hypothetical protein
MREVDAVDVGRKKRSGTEVLAQLNTLRDAWEVFLRAQC